MPSEGPKSSLISRGEGPAKHAMEIDANQGLLPLDAWHVEVLDLQYTDKAQLSCICNARGAVGLVS